MQKKIINLRRLRQVFISLMLVSCVFLSGCSSVHELEVKFGFKNNDFEYIKNNKIQKIVIQNTRDQGFRFVIQDQQAIKDLYDILSSAKAVKQKSSLQPDYTFEMYEGNKVHKFNYIAGLDKKDKGNLYGDNKVYEVSKRIDNDIINNFWTIREPKDFENVYYKSIIVAMDQYLKSEKNQQNKSIGVNLNDDVDAAKFILSSDIEGFKSDLNDKFKKVSIANKDKENYDIWVIIKTEGYKSTLYKGTVMFWDKSEQSEKKYYVFDKYENTRWNIKVSENKPDGF